MKFFRHILRHIPCILILLSSGRAITSQAQGVAPETHVKAAILFNLIRFSVWPGTHGENFNLCTLTDKNMHAALDSLDGKKVNGTPLKLTHYKAANDVGTDCHVLFSSKNLSNTPLDFEKLHGQNILTVGDRLEFLKSGGCISIQRAGKKMRFSINRAAIEMTHVRPSSKILRLAVDPEVPHD